MIDVQVDEGYQVTYDLARVVGLAEQAVATAPNAAMEISTDGSRLRFNAGPTTMLTALGREGRWENGQLTRTFSPCKPIAVEPEDGCSTLRLLRSNLAEGGKRLYLTRCAEAPSGWLVGTNVLLDLRRRPYNTRERYVVKPVGIDGECYVLDQERGLPYRTKRGQWAVTGSVRQMRELADRLNGSPSQR
ncbi:hypothetical protein [Nonomuraea fuscirosea]|uniref:hypothetical protein n=1 Tax=Nonomuraea fuscirosea TaxID=1291556 RepID=UPI0033E57BA8